MEFVYGSLAGNPEQVGRELQLELVGRHAARRGDYRVIYQINRPAGVVLIVHVDHRADGLPAGMTQDAGHIARFDHPLLS